MSRIELTLLGPRDVDRIVAIERASFAPALQADRDVVLERFDLGHTMIGARDSDRLVGLISFSYARFSPQDFDGFPKTFRKFSMQPIPNDYNAVFIYNLEINRAKRGRGHARLLLCEALDQAKAAGCKYAVGDGRISSYQGADRCVQEHVRRKTRLNEGIDRYLNGGRFPTTEEFLADPTLALYHRLTGCEFLWILPNFIPEDRAAGGCRVIVFGELATWRQRARPSPQAVSASALGGEL